MKNPPSHFLLARPHAASACNTASATNLADLDAQVLAIIEEARDQISSPLARLSQTYPPFAVGKSTFLKHVSLKEQIQPVHCGPRVTAYRVVDRDAALASMALAARHGFMLNMKAFVAALYAPIAAMTKGNA